MSSVAVDTSSAAEELTTAAEYQRKAGRRAACLMIVLVIVTAVVLLAVSPSTIGLLSLCWPSFSSTDFIVDTVLGRSFSLHMGLPSCLLHTYFIINVFCFFRCVFNVHLAGFFFSEESSLSSFGQSPALDDTSHPVSIQRSSIAAVESEILVMYCKLLSLR